MRTAHKLGGLGILALASAVSSTTAFADIPAVTARFYVSGASAARAIPPAIAADLCDPAVNDRADYLDNLTNVNYRVTVCTLRNTTGQAALNGKKVAVFSRSAGGTLFGVRPIGVPQAIKFIDPLTCPTDDGNPTTQQVCTGLTADADYAALDGSNDGQVPDFGVSDQEPVFNCEVARENGPVQCTAAELAGLRSAKVTAAPTYQLIWSIQAGAGVDVDGVTGSGINGFATELGGNVSKTVLTAIFSGNYTSVAQVKTAMGVTPDAGDDALGLKICRRTNTSGTQAGHSNLWVGSNFCGSQTKAASFVDEAFDDNNVANGYPANYDVVENGSSSALELCLTTPATDRARTIGINSLENAAPAGTAELSIDGIAANLTNGALGRYPWYAESTLNSNSDVINNVVANLPTGVSAQLAGRATTAERAAFLTVFRNNVRNPARIVASGLNGINALPNFFPPTNPYVATNPRAWVTKNVGAGGNNCKPSNMAFP